MFLLTLNIGSYPRSLIMSRHIRSPAILRQLGRGLSSSYCRLSFNSSPDLHTPRSEYPELVMRVNPSHSPGPKILLHDVFPFIICETIKIMSSDTSGSRRHEGPKIDTTVLEQPITFPFSRRTAPNRLLKAPMTERLCQWSKEGQDIVFQLPPKSPLKLPRPISHSLHPQLIY
jgi:hypothetical protein